MKKRLISLAVTLAFILACMSTTITAVQLSSSDQDVDTYSSVELGGTLTRTIEDTRIIVTWVSFDATETYTLIREGENIYLNGELFDKINIVASPYESTNISDRASSNIKWGTWQTFSQQIDTGGVPTILVASLIALTAPWWSIKFIATAVASVASSEFYTVSGKMRYGHDDVYSYYERYTSLQSDSGRYLITDSFDTERKLSRGEMIFFLFFGRGRGRGGRATAKPNDNRRSSADGFAVRMKQTKAGGRVVKSCSPFSAAKWQRQKSRQSRV